MTLSTPLGRVFASVLAILTITALIIAVAQVAAQESGGGSADGEEGTESGEVAEGDEGDRHTCWDHWFCSQHTPVPPTPVPPTAVPYCNLHPLVLQCLSATSTPGAHIPAPAHGHPDTAHRHPDTAHGHAHSASASNGYTAPASADSPYEYACST